MAEDTKDPLKIAEGVFELLSDVYVPRRMLYHYYRRWLELRTQELHEDSLEKELFDLLDPLFRCTMKNKEVGAGQLLMMHNLLKPGEPMAPYIAELDVYRQAYRQGRWGMNVYQELYDWTYGVDPFSCNETFHHLFVETA